MRLTHELTHPHIVAGLQRRDRFQNAVLLGRHVTGGGTQRRFEPGQRRIEILRRDVDEPGAGELALGLLGSGAPLVVGAVHEPPLLARVRHDDHVVGRHGNRRDVEGLAIHRQRVPAPAVGDDELIHDPAGHPDEFVLGDLPGLRQLGRGESEVEPVVQRHAEGQLDGRRRAQTRTVGNVAADPDVESVGYHGTAFAQGIGHGHQIVRPAPGFVVRRVVDIDVDRAGLGEVHRAATDQAVVTAVDPQPGAAVDGHRQDETAHVVDVVADEIRPAWCLEYSHICPFSQNLYSRTTRDSYGPKSLPRKLTG